MGFLCGSKYIYKAYDGGIFECIDNPNDTLFADGTYLKYRNITVPYSSDFLYPADGALCLCVSSDPVILEVAKLCYGGIKDSLNKEFNYIKTSLKNTVGLLHESEVMVIQQALYCVTERVDEEFCSNVTDALCMYLELEWSANDHSNGGAFIRNTVHTVLFGHEVSDFIFIYKMSKPSATIVANTNGADNRIHLYLDGMDVQEAIKVLRLDSDVGNNVKSLLQSASGDKVDKAYDYANMFCDWFTCIPVKCRSLVDTEDRKLCIYAQHNDLDGIRANFTYEQVKDVMKYVYTSMPPENNEEQRVFAEDMYNKYSAEDWGTVKERDPDLFRALCTGETLGDYLYNKMMFDLMRMQLSLEYDAVDQDTKDAIDVFIKWVDVLSRDSFGEALVCHEDAILAAKKNDYDYFVSPESPAVTNVMRMYYNRKLYPATSDWAYEFYNTLYTKQSIKAWKKLLEIDDNLFSCAANCYSLMSGVYTSAILDNISNNIYTE